MSIAKSLLKSNIKTIAEEVQNLERDTKDDQSQDRGRGIDDEIAIATIVVKGVKIASINDVLVQGHEIAEIVIVTAIATVIVMAIIPMSSGVILNIERNTKRTGVLPFALFFCV